MVLRSALDPMKQRPRLVTLAMAVLVCIGCDLGTADQQVVGCPPEAKTCAGASDCFSTCMCEGPSRSRCDARCGASMHTRVTDLDESGWEDDWLGFEDDVLHLVNQARAKSGCCGDEGCFAASGALAMNPQLRRAARAHAKDMAERDYFAHDDPDGLTPFDRMRESGFRGCAMGENIASGQPSAEAVVEGWLNSPGHCANIRNPGFDQLGVGYQPMSNASSGPLSVKNSAVERSSVPEVRAQKCTSGRSGGRPRVRLRGPDSWGRGSRRTRPLFWCDCLQPVDMWSTQYRHRSRRGSAAPCVRGAPCPYEGRDGPTTLSRG